VIRNSKQKWEVGQTVKQGFLSLVVMAAIPTPGDGLPDAYVCTNSEGDKLYEVIPYNGYRRIDLSEARELFESARKVAKQVATRATERAAHASAITSLFAEVA
jgi:hypothetical protein